MDVIARPAVDQAFGRHPDAETWLNAWWTTARRQQWTSLQHVRQAYPTNDQVGSCLVFDALGNRYRLVVGVRYATDVRGGTLFVKHFLTHAEYDKGVWKKDCGYDD